MKKTSLASILFAGALLALAATAEAQQPKKVPQVAYLSLNSQSQNIDLYTAFLQGLHQLGYIENKNVMIEARWADQNVDRLSALAAELVSLKVDVIVASSPQSALAAKKATTTIPIVLAVGNDPVELGLISSLARPGGNMRAKRPSSGRKR